jgi:hypothetical protein
MTLRVHVSLGTVTYNVLQNFYFLQCKNASVGLGLFWIEVSCFPFVYSTTIKTVKQMLKTFY